VEVFYSRRQNSCSDDVSGLGYPEGRDVALDFSDVDAFLVILQMVKRKGLTPSKTRWIGEADPEDGYGTCYAR